MTEHTLARLAKLKDGSGHSIFAPSSAHMWLACSGSLIPNILAPDDAGVDAAYGTVAHAVTAEWLKTGVRPDHLLGTNEFIDSGDWGHLIWIDEEMLHYVEQSVDQCEWIPGKHLIERRVDFSHLTPIPNQGGTLDFAAILLSTDMRARSIVLTDHKYGSSPENIVWAEENPQLMLYAIGADIEFGPFDNFTLRINQPRLNHFDEWYCDRSRLMEFAVYVKERAALAWSLDAPRTAGPKQCRFCAVRASCPANAKMQEDLVSAAFESESVQTVEQMRAFAGRLDDDMGELAFHFAATKELTTGQMARLLPFRGMADAWWKALEEELTRRALNGEKVRGMKLVEARTRRRFNDAASAEAKLIELGLIRSDIVSEHLVSPSQAEKLLVSKAKFRRKDLPELLHGLVRKPPGGATLVTLKDRREEIADPASFAFANDDPENPETEEM